MLPAWVRVWTDSSSITSEAEGTAPVTVPQLSVRSHRKLPKGSEYAVQIQGSVEVLEAGAALCFVGGDAGCSVSREPPKLVRDGCCSSLPRQRWCSSSLPRQQQSPPPEDSALCLAEQSVDVAPTSVQTRFSLRGPQRHRN